MGKTASNLCLMFWFISVPHLLALSLHLPLHNNYVNPLINCEDFMQTRRTYSQHNFPKYTLLPCETPHHQNFAALNVFFGPLNDIQVNAK